MFIRQTVFLTGALCAFVCASADESGLQLQADGSSGMNDTNAQGEQEIAQLDTVHVVALRGKSYSLSTKSIVSGEFSGRYPDAASLLQTVSGVTIYKTGGLGAYSDMSIRGSGSNQVQVYLDGMPLNTAAGGAVDLSKIPLNMLSKITVYKSTSPLELSGRNAGGVVELVSGPGYGRKTVSAIAEAGSYGYLKGGALVHNPSPRVLHRLSVDYAHSDNDYPYIYDPTPSEAGDEEEKLVDNHAFTSLDAVYSACLGLDSAGRHRLSGQMSLHNSRQGLFNYAVPDSNDGYSRDRTTALQGKYSGMVSPRYGVDVAISARVKENLFQRKMPYYIGNARKRRTIYPFMEGMLVGKRIFCECFLVRGVAGGSYDGYFEKDLWAAPGGEEPYAHRFTVRGGIEGEFTVRDIVRARVRAGGVYEIDSTNGDSFHDGMGSRPAQSDRATYPSGQGEIRVQALPKLAMSLAGTYGNRSPSLHEKFARSDKSFGNENLLPESRSEVELGVEFSIGALSSLITGYVNQTGDKIKWISVSQNMFVPQNIETVHGKGLEWDLRLGPAPWLLVSNSLTYMHNIIGSEKNSDWDGNYEPLLPQFKERNEIRLTFSRITIGHTLLYSSRYYRGPHNRQYIDPGFECGIYAQLSIAKKIWITYRLDNYLNTIDFTAEGYEPFERLPKPGRMHYLVLQITV
ncbi:MAG: TonB-dependent receptor [Chitinivibrionales bacterium]|nr:TonB-dependent receptor [Chitinivibrionales bacterium]